jgi:hypothetical protein
MGGRPARKAHSLTSICEPIVYTMWEPRHLTACLVTALPFELNLTTTLSLIPLLLLLLLLLLPPPLLLLLLLLLLLGHAITRVVVKALGCKQEGRGFDSL